MSEPTDEITRDFFIKPFIGDNTKIQYVKLALDYPLDKPGLLLRLERLLNAKAGISDNVEVAAKNHWVGIYMTPGEGSAFQNHDEWINHLQGFAIGFLEANGIETV